MKQKILLGICIAILLFATPVMATFSRNYETASVARIVGNSPSDMEQQLTAQDIDIKHATISTQFINDSIGRITTGILGSDPDKVNDLFADSFIIPDRNLNQEDFDQFQKNELLYVDVGINTIDESGLKSAAVAKQPLFIYNKDYAGITTSSGLTKSISKDAVVIAPTFYKSTEFANAVLCNLKNNRELGEVFMQARNNYYWNSNIQKEPIGLMLLSYMFYGLPTRKTAVLANPPSNLCGGYQEDFTTASNENFNIMSDEQNSSTYTKYFEFRIDDFIIAPVGDYSLIETGKTVNSMTPFELVLPKKTLVEEFPKNTVITSFSVISMEDPVDITVTNLPSVNESGLMPRVCLEQTRNASVEFADSYTEDARAVIVNIYPVEILDCNEGRFRMYKTIKYELEYAPYSPVLIKDISAEKELLPEQETNITIEIENIQDGPVTGLLVLKDDAENVIIAQNITTTRDKYDLELIAPEREGLYNYRVDFYYQNESRTYKEFSFEVKTLDVALRIPEKVIDDVDFELVIYSGLASAFSTTIDYYLMYNGLIVDSKTKTVTLDPGNNSIMLSFADLDRSKITYDIFVGIPYQTKYKTDTATILTEHAPVIVQSNVNIKENETYILLPEVYDMDEDPVTSSITYPLNYGENWTSSFEDSGEYNITITANDGIKTTTNIVKLTIENTNRPPVIDVVEEIHVNETNLISINANISDPDNSNNVSNDDNTLTITYGAPLDVNGTYLTTFDDFGEITTYVTVSDGELTDTKEVKLIIDNVNRPPNLDALTDFQVAEGTPINLKLAFDPDNQNNVTNDDSNLTFVFSGGKIRSDGGWDTTFDDSGVYPIAVEISDGEVTVNKTVTLTISNVNRPPLITAPDLIYAVGYADLSQYIVELDNQNAVTNDDNELTIRYTAPFDSAGKWMPSVAGMVTSVISVSDGEFLVQKSVTVILDNVSQPQSQTPPVAINDTFTAPNETAPVIDTIVPVNNTVILPVNDTIVPVNDTRVNVTVPVNVTLPVVENQTSVNGSAGLTDVVVTPVVVDTRITDVIVVVVTDNGTAGNVTQTAQNTSQPQNTTQTSQNTTQQTETFQTTTYSIPFIPLSQPIVPVEGLGVEVFVNSKKVSESDSVKVKPGKEVKVKVELENRDNVSKDVSVSAEVGDLDEDGKDSFILLPGARDEFKLIFEIPRLTDDDNYPLKVLVNDKETKEWNVVLKVDKPAHELSIRYFSIDPIVCGQVSTELKVRVENTGKNDEEGVLELVGESVGLSEKISFELEQGESKAFTRTVSAPEGSHEVSARVVYGKKSVLSKTSFTSSVCKAEQAVSTQSEPGKERFAFLSQQKANIVAESAPVEDIFSFVFLTVLTVFALLLFVFIVPPLFRG